MKENATLGRRDFVKTFVIFSAGSCLGGKRVLSLFVGDVAAQSADTVGVFQLSLDSFPALATDYGSLLLTVPGMPATFSQIIVTRMPGPQYYAVTSMCTHDGFTVNPYDTTLGLLRCPLHGSEYQADGTLVQGPAKRSLTSYPATFDGAKTVAIQIPGLGFSVSIIVPTNPAFADWKQLQFPTVYGLSYEVRYRASLSAGSWAQVGFTTNPLTGLIQTVLNGTDNPATIYVPAGGAQGFYAVVRYLPNA